MNSSITYDNSDDPHQQMGSAGLVVMFANMTVPPSRATRHEQPG